MIKKRKLLSLLLVLSMVVAGFTMPANATAKNSIKAKQKQTAMSKRQVMSIAEDVMEGNDYVEGQVMVVLKPESSSKQAKFSTGDFPEVTATKVENLTYCENPDSDLIADDFRTVVLVTLKHKTDEELVQAIDRLMDREDVESISLNEVMPVEAVQTVPPSDSQYNNQWALEKIDAMGAWSKTTGSSAVKVGIIDTGIDYTHDELAPNMWKNPGETEGDGKDNDGNGYKDDIYGWNFHNNNSNVMDTHYHGTFCAGIVAADLNHKDVAGIAPSVKLVALKVGDTGFYFDAAVKAVNYAANMGIDVVNYSSSFHSKNTGFESALRNYDGIFVTSAGNDGRDNDVTANYPKTNEHINVIKVANTGSNDALTSTSNYGDVDVTLAAPGGSVLSTTLNNTYEYGSGTSYSSPYTAGVVALIKSQYPQLNNTQVIKAIKEGVDVLPSLEGKVETGGRLNANKAMEAARFKSTARSLEDRYGIEVYDYDDFILAMEGVYTTIYVLNDIKLQDDFKVIKNKKFYGGAKLIGNGKRHFIIENDDITLNLGGLVLSNGGIENRSSNLKLEGSGAVIKGGNWTYGGAINNTGTMTATGIRIENNSATFGGGIYNTGTMTLTDTTVYNNQATDGGALYADGTTVVSGGIYKKNTSDGNGGAWYGGPNSNVTLYNSPKLTYNTSRYYGGGIYTCGKLSTQMPDGFRVDYNSAQSGGGIYAKTGANINLEGKSQGGPSISICNNTASENGGGIYLNSLSKLYLHNAFVCANTAEGLGGGMFVQSQAQFTKGFAQFIGPDNDIYYN